MYCKFDVYIPCIPSQCNHCRFLYQSVSGHAGLALSLITPSATPANTGDHEVVKFVEHLRLLYPQLSNVANKSYPEMIKEIPFQCYLENPVNKIVYHYDSLTPAEGAEAVKILMGKINITAVFNWQPVFNEMAIGRDVSVPVGTADDFRFVLGTCFEDARRAKSLSVFYKYTVTGNSETHFGAAKVSFKEKIKPI